MVVGSAEPAHRLPLRSVRGVVLPVPRQHAREHPDPEGLQRIDIREGEMWLLPGNVFHSPQRPEEGSIRHRDRTHPPKRARSRSSPWFCPNCNAKVHEVELQVRDIVEDLPPVFRDFLTESEEGRTCPECRRRPSRQGLKPLGHDRRPHPLRAEFLPDLSSQVGPGLWPTLTRGHRARGDDHARRDRVPSHRRRPAGTLLCAWPTWMPTAVEMQVVSPHARLLLVRQVGR